MARRRCAADPAIAPPTDMAETSQPEHSALMDFLEQAWDLTGTVFGGLANGFERSITRLFGSSNARYVRKMQPKVAAITALEPKYQAMSDEELAANGRVPPPAGRRRNARRSADRSLRRLPRGGPAVPAACGISTCR